MCSLMKGSSKKLEFTHAEVRVLEDEKLDLSKMNLGLLKFGPQQMERARIYRR